MTAESRRLTSRAHALIAVAATLCLAVVDYLTGYETVWFGFYAMIVAYAVWFVGRPFGVLLSPLCVALWATGFVLGGGRYTGRYSMLWNSVTFLLAYLVIVVIMSRLRDAHLGLERKVRERTEALTVEMEQRARLEKEILAIGERERRRIGYDLHDNLGQHLTGTAFAVQVLAANLQEQGRPEARDALGVVKLVEEGIRLTRDISRGLQPIEPGGEAFVAALQELAVQTRERFGIECGFRRGQPLPRLDETVATHLYHIAQESVVNAVRHGKPRRIDLGLDAAGGGLTLTVADDGIGVPAGAEGGGGLGLQIMRHRAAMINAAIDVQAAPAGGTIVTCRLGGPG